MVLQGAWGGLDLQELSRPREWWLMAAVRGVSPTVHVSASAGAGGTQAGAAGAGLQLSKTPSCL